MTALVAGVDFSSTQIDVAILPLDTDHGDPDLPSATLRREAIPQTRKHLRPAHAAYLMQRLLDPVAGYDVVTVWVEEPYSMSMNVTKVLAGVSGGIIAGAWRPRGTRDVETITVHEWRDELGMKGGGPTHDFKAASIEKANGLYPGLPVWISDHACEALLIAHAARQLMQKAAA